MPSDLLYQRLLTSAVVRCPFLSEGAKMTLLYLFSLGSHQMSVCEIAHARGKNDSTIQSHFKELKKQKFVQVAYKSGPKNSTCVYSCHPENIYKSLGFSVKDCKAIICRNSAIINAVRFQFLNPDFLFDLTEKLHAKKIELPNSNEHVRFLNKKRNEYSRGDVVKYYRQAYKRRTGQAHRVTNKRDLILCSQLLKKFWPEIICDVIDHTFSKRGDLDSLTFDVFYRNADRYFRQTFDCSQDSPNFKKPRKKQKVK